MTTIAANRKEICADSCLSWDSAFMVIKDKVEIVNRQVVGCAGHTPSIDKFLRWLRNPVSEVPDLDDGEDKGFDALVLNERGLWVYSHSCYPALVMDNYAAIGSGGDAAKAAMLCGKSPRAAVEIACLVDKNSKPPVQRITLAQALKRKV